MRIGCVVSVNPRAWSCQNHYVSQQRFYQRQNIINKNEPIIHRVSPSIWSCFFQIHAESWKQRAASGQWPITIFPETPQWGRSNTKHNLSRSFAITHHPFAIHSPSIHHPFTKENSLAAPLRSSRYAREAFQTPQDHGPVRRACSIQWRTLFWRGDFWSRLFHPVDHIIWFFNTYYIYT